MPRNIEIKARVADESRLRRRIEALCSAAPERLVQHDTFYRGARGRLKLRRFADGSAELIHYERADATGPRSSVYSRCAVDEPDALAVVLERAFGVLGVVRKERLLYLAGETRVHLDRVDGLGTFVELEVVLAPEQTEAYGRGRASELMGELGIEATDLVAAAYVDLLAVARGRGAAAHPGAEPLSPVEVSLAPLTPADWPAIRSIYREGIETGMATFETELPDWPEWDRAHLAACRLVALHAGRVVGWAALLPVSARPCYRGVAEVSVYVAPVAQRFGIGRALLTRLIADSAAAGIWTLQAGIFRENQASLSLPATCGFRRVGVRERVGQLRGEWRDVVLLERRRPEA
jgi:phosphinothricin acetyltransferase